MKDTTVLNRISKVIENMNYKSVYIEIHTDTDKYTLEKEKPLRIIGFTGGNNECKRKH